MSLDLARRRLPQCQLLCQLTGVKRTRYARHEVFPPPARTVGALPRPSSQRGCRIQALHFPLYGLGLVKTAAHRSGDIGPDQEHRCIPRRTGNKLIQSWQAIAREPEPLWRVQEQVSKLEGDAVRYPSDPQIPVNTFRIPRYRPARRGLIGLLLAACIFVAAFALQSSYGDAVRPIIARWSPQLVPTSSQLLEKPALSAQPSPPGVQVATAEPAPQAQTTQQDVGPTAAQVPPVLAQLLQTMMRDFANVEQEIEQLKTSQEEMARDNLKVAEQVKASQEQMARLIAKANEQKPNPPAPPTRPIATPTREPARTLLSRQATARPQAPPQLPAEKP